MFTITKSFTLSASHCILGHPKCGRMHGHNYQIEIIIGADDDLLNESGMLIDFSVLKKILADVLGPYDHMHLGTIPEGWNSNPTHVIEMPFKQTTAENLTKYWGEKVQAKIKPLKLIQVNVFESQNSKASWIPE